MNENSLMFIVNVIMNFLDVFVVYYFCQNLINKTAKISLKIIIFSLLYSIISSLLIHYFDSYTYRTIATLSMLTVIKISSNRKIYDVIIIFAVYFLCGILIQNIILVTISNLDLMLHVRYILVQLLTLCIAILLYKKVSLQKFLNTIEKHILLRLLIFNSAIIILIILCYTTFTYTNTYYIYFSVLLSFTFIALYQTIKRVSFYTNEIPAQVHDVKNILTNLQILAHDNNITEKKLTSEIDMAIEILGLPKENTSNPIESNKNIQAIIDKKKKNDLEELTILADIKYLTANQKLGYISAGYILEVLLDNAIETGTRKPILVKVYIDNDALILSVGNEYERKTPNDFHKMLKKGYSTKKGNGRGHGLSNLSTFVNKHNGDIILSYEYCQKQNCNYLIMTVDIGDWKVMTPNWIKEIMLLT